ncbi:MAG: RNA-directed DNA polymerase [Burkholderiales bacterium]|nr:MAG: RNA-directed DNA polymerase [Burkholderiales bacterium]
MKKKHTIRRSDYTRILITETTPYETPIIFSNDGLYDRIQGFETADHVEKTLIESIVFGLGNTANSTFPYHYKIKKNSFEFRRLALLHPWSQWRMKEFYQKYERLIVHYCAISPASIRAPNGIASSFYSKSSWENINQYKTVAVDLSGLDRYVKHSPSFFSYRGYDRLYKFFNGKQYFSLEKRFSILTTLDVSKCFDSIYTHGLTWALKDKAFAKQNKSASSFADEFDRTIRHGNHDETNGIPIGPEASRVFAEILFQEIDRQAIDRISEYRYGTDYIFHRYVDDVFIFARDESTSRLIYDTYADVLVSFNLHANIGKSTTSQRPFATTKSRLVHEAGIGLNEFIDKFLVGDSIQSLLPGRISSHWKLTKSYIDSVKSLCAQHGCGYDEIASFLISALTERVKKLVNAENIESEDQLSNQYLRAIQVLLEVLFFLYSVAPSVGASYKLCTSIILLHRFAAKHISDVLPTVSQQIYDLSSALLLDECDRTHGGGIDRFVHLECLNIVLAIRELGSSYLLPQQVLRKLFVNGSPLTYFTIVSCLFYIGNSSEYTEIRKEILDAVTTKLANLSDVLVDGEKALLLLDMLSCPLVAPARKDSWIKSLYRTLNKGAPTKTELAAFNAKANDRHWQINWADLDLLNSLEKKELKQAY